MGRQDFLLFFNLQGFEGRGNFDEKAAFEVIIGFLGLALSPLVLLEGRISLVGRPLDAAGMIRPIAGLLEVFSRGDRGGESCTRGYQKKCHQNY
jgi:hypothetical protein